MRRSVATTAVLLSLAIGGAIAWETMAPAADVQSVAPMVRAEDPQPERVRAAVERGLRWLRQSQDPKTGGWIQDVGYKRGAAYVRTAIQKPHVGVSGLCLMAFLSGGHLPGRGLHGSVVERGVDYVLRSVDPNLGFITGHDTRMYSHAFATLLLAEIYGMTHRADVKEKLQLAIDLIVKSQNKLGSWRYRPYSDQADMSITVCQIMALRAARNVGIRVPRRTIDRAYNYVERSAYKNRNQSNFGGFKYKLESNSRTSFALTAAGIATLNHAGVYDNELIRAGIEYLKSTMPRFNRLHARHYFYFYGHYYASQVFFLCSDQESTNHLWDWYWPRIAEDLLSHQLPNGSWANRTGPGAAFSTAVACIILQIPNQYLPIFHR